MKYYFLLLLLIVMSSCKDVIDSDPNYDKTYKKGAILANQMNDVLQPLCSGNYWIYKVTTFDSDRTVTSVRNDTMKVIDSVTVDGDLWYRMDQFNYLINTESGLWSKCGECTSAPRFEFPYPCKNGNLEFYYEFGNHHSKVVDSSGNYLDIYSSDTIYRNMDVMKETSVTINSIDYSTIKYSYLNILKSNIPFIELKSKDWRREEYYVQNLGKVYYKLYKNEIGGPLYLSETWELIEYHLNN